MAVSLKLQDTSDTLEFTLLQPPLTDEQIEGLAEIETLDGNIYLDFRNKKRLASHSWRYMDEELFLQLKAFYDRQFTTRKFPLLTITGLETVIIDVPVRMRLSAAEYIDNCGTVENVDASFRETVQSSRDYNTEE